MAEVSVPQWLLFLNTKLSSYLESKFFLLQKSSMVIFILGAQVSLLWQALFSESTEGLIVLTFVLFLLNVCTGVLYGIKQLDVVVTVGMGVTFLTVFATMIMLIIRGADFI